MKYAIIYWSHYGNNKKLVDSLALLLNHKGAETQIFTTDEVNPTKMPTADMYVFFSPAEAFNLQKNMILFMKNLSGMEGEKYGIMNTHWMQKNRLGKMEKLLSHQKMIKIAEVDFLVDKDGQGGYKLKENWEAKLAEFANKI
jgi:flavodoxin